MYFLTFISRKLVQNGRCEFLNLKWLPLKLTQNDYLSFSYETRVYFQSNIKIKYSIQSNTVFNHLMSSHPSNFWNKPSLLFIRCTISSYYREIKLDNDEYLPCGIRSLASNVDQLVEVLCSVTSTNQVPDSMNMSPTAHVHERESSHVLMFDEHESHFYTRLLAVASTLGGTHPHPSP